MLQGILGIASVLGGLGNAQGGRRTMGKGMGYMDDARNNALQQFRQRSDWYNTQKAMGAYNPQQAYDWANAESARNTKVGSSNIAAKLGGLGYRNGDSIAPQQQRQFSDQQKNQLAKMLLDIQNMTRQQQSNDLASVENAGRNYQGLSSSLGRDIYSIGQQQSANSGLGSALGNLAGLASGGAFNFLKMGGGNQGIKIPYTY